MKTFKYYYPGEDSVDIPYRISIISNDILDISFLLDKTRSYNGFDREKAFSDLEKKLTTLTDKERLKLLPYYFLWLADYVFEISNLVAKSDIFNVSLDCKKEINKNNLHFLNYLRQLSISYRNEYYRKDFKSYKFYPAIIVFENIIDI